MHPRDELAIKNTLKQNQEMQDIDSKNYRIDSQCFEYLGYITLGRAGTFRAWKVYQGKKLDSLDKIRLSF